MFNVGDRVRFREDRPGVYYNPDVLYGVITEKSNITGDYGVEWDNGEWGYFGKSLLELVGEVLFEI